MRDCRTLSPTSSSRAKKFQILAQCGGYVGRRRGGEYQSGPAPEPFLPPHPPPSEASSAAEAHAYQSTFIHHHPIPLTTPSHHLLCHSKLWGDVSDPDWYMGRAGEYPVHDSPPLHPHSTLRFLNRDTCIQIDIYFPSSHPSHHTQCQRPPSPSGEGSRILGLRICRRTSHSPSNPPITSSPLRRCTGSSTVISPSGITCLRNAALPPRRNCPPVPFCFSWGKKFRICILRNSAHVYMFCKNTEQFNLFLKSYQILFVSPMAQKPRRADTHSLGGSGGSRFARADREGDPSAAQPPGVSQGNRQRGRQCRSAARPDAGAPRSRHLHDKL